MAAPETPKYHWVCAHCGSKNVSCDATVRWSYESQAWEVSDVLDGDYCDDCEGECRVEQKYDGEGE